MWTRRSHCFLSNLKRKKQLHPPTPHPRSPPVKASRQVVVLPRNVKASRRRGNQLPWRLAGGGGGWRSVLLKVSLTGSGDGGGGCFRGKQFRC